MSWPGPVRLEGRFSTLEPLTVEHHGALVDAVKDGELWRLWYTVVPGPRELPVPGPGKVPVEKSDEMTLEIQRRLELQASGSMLPFAVLDANDIPVGMTTFMNVDATNRRLEIGSTWYAKRVQRTALNTECKLMLLRHAFEELDCIAVELRTSFLNLQSRRAIERLGAKLDGVLRNHQLHSDGTLRDTAVYSITQSEWPAVKSHLTFQLERDR